MSTIVHSRTQREYAPRPATEGPEPGLLETIGARFRLSEDDQELTQAPRNAEAYAELLDTLEDLGVDVSERGPMYMDAGSDIPGALRTMRVYDRDAIYAEVQRQRARNPKYFSSLPQTRDEYDQWVATRRGGRAADQRVAARGSRVVGIAGDVASGLTDPYNLATGLAGAGQVSLARTVLIEGLLGAGAAPLNFSGTERARARMGEEYTASDKLADVGMGAVTGGVLGGAVRGVEIAAPKIAGRVGDRAGVMRDRFEHYVAENWERLPKPVRDKWGSAAKVDEAALPDIFEAVVGRVNMSVDERLARDGLRREAEIDAASPFLPGLPGNAAHRTSLADAMEQVIANVDRSRPARPVAARVRDDTAIGSRTVRVPGRPGQIGYANDVYQFFRAKGLSEAQARGIAAGIHAESRSDHAVRGGYKGRAVGLGQWLGSRRAALIARYGENPSRQQQLAFLWEELRGGDAGGRHVLAAKDEKAVLDAYIRKFMRPAKGAETTGDLKRGMEALGRGGEDIRVDDAPAARGEGIDPEAEVEADLARRRAQLEVDQARLDADTAASRAADVAEREDPLWIDGAESWLDDVEIMSMPELRRDQFPDDASWRAAQMERDANELGISPASLLDADEGAVRAVGDEVAEKSAAARTAATVADVGRRLEIVAERSGFELRELRDNFDAWKARDGEAAAIDLLAAKEAELGIEPPAQAMGAAAPGLLPDDLAAIAVPIGLDADGTHSSGFYRFDTPRGPISWAPATGAANGRIVSRRGVTADDVRAAIAASGGPSPVSVDVEEAAARGGWDDAADRDAVLTADSAVHDMDALHGEGGEAIEFYLGEDGAPVSWAELRAELDVEESEIANIRGCL